MLGLILLTTAVERYLVRGLGLNAHCILIRQSHWSSALPVGPPAAAIKSEFISFVDLPRENPKIYFFCFFGE